jgi:hypothetical protein
MVWAACTPKDDRSKGGDPGSSSAGPAASGGPFAAGAPVDGLVAAVTSSDLTKADVQEKLPARLRELAASAKEPRAASVMLHALSTAKPKDAAMLGCELLDKLPPLPHADENMQLFVDASLLAVANGKGTCTDAVKKRLGKDRCMQSVRCTKEGGRIGLGASTDQREPLCSADDMAKEVARELGKKKEELLGDKPSYATERYAFAALRAMNAVPEDMEKAHARRQYALKQADKPECGMGLAVGAPCHCDEAALRDQVCRNDTTAVSFSFCHLDVNDAKKELGPVTMSTPP